MAHEKIIHAMKRLQSQTSSGPNSLVQRALIHFLDIKDDGKYFDPLFEGLRNSTQYLRHKFKEANLSHCFYQTSSAFYYLLDFSRTPMFEHYKSEPQKDCSAEIVEELLEETGVALVPGSSFGQNNCARMSLTLETIPFQEGVDKLFQYLTKK